MTTSLAGNLIEERMLEVEHRQLREGLSALQESIDDAHRLGREALGASAARSLAWLRREVLAHAAWEEAWIYPSIDHIAGTPWATRALRFEHDQIRDSAHHLEVAFQAVEQRWNSELAFQLVAALTRVEALVSARSRAGRALRAAPHRGPTRDSLGTPTPRLDDQALDPSPHWRMNDDPHSRGL